MKEEPEIIINGVNVGPGCAMTIRVAIENFATDLVHNGLEDDERGIDLMKNYMNRINDIRYAMGLIDETT